jgi:hypothetical protein
MAEGWISCMDMEPHLMESDIRYLNLRTENIILFVYCVVPSVVPPMATYLVYKV